MDWLHRRSLESGLVSSCSNPRDVMPAFGLSSLLAVAVALQYGFPSGNMLPAPTRGSTVVFSSPLRDARRSDDVCYHSDQNGAGAKGRYGDFEQT